MYEEFDELSEEDEKILDNIWDQIGAELKLEEQGLGKPKWTMESAKDERPDLKKEDLTEWVRIANEEYRRLRMKKIYHGTAAEKAVRLANRKVPKTSNVSKPPTKSTTPKTQNVPKSSTTSKPPTKPKTSNVSKVKKTAKAVKVVKAVKKKTPKRT